MKLKLFKKKDSRKLSKRLKVINKLDKKKELEKVQVPEE